MQIDEIAQRRAQQSSSAILPRYSSDLALEEYLKGLLARSTAADELESICEPAPGVDESAWLYELVRRICLDLNWLIVDLLHGMGSEGRTSYKHH